ncbi:hypothetical protein PTTG_25152 [Puccinia triticina 1-1 BBBD Race 1]|uniref:SRR1 domain-containing protein n=2 Tax=Puccinia triticina TaxID=208348 RepID=A0A180H4U4_PUCT1|nr:uncharacterized protein PtA15_9A214 [Puccinia triticina]OAW00047.1 hypothetical protein PTTG_25152 [Puccinia triticina 1-1 BBBD Race 1]WAQ88089.1 hypothetical protein PtA15_9A214 [Puccinia triticina]WAR60277.1 hypothetical protein PtB15_9B214 [Puccinia triticina]
MQKDNDQTGGFQYVEQRSTKKNRKRRNNGKYKATLDLANRAPPDLGLHLDNRRSVMEKSRWLSSSSTWLTQCLNDEEAPPPPRRILCLALGSFSPDTASQHMLSPGVASCTGIHGQKQSQYQLVFLLDVILPILSKGRQSNNSDLQGQEFQNDSAMDWSHKSNLKVCFYDPAFTEKDKENLRKFGHDVLDAEPSLYCEEPTFFYMPHAPKTLYERLVCENSTPNHGDNLSRIILMGNDIKSYQKIMVQEEKDTIPVLLDLDPLTIHTRYPPDLTKLNQDTGVHFFNETCFQWFTKP